MEHTFLFQEGQWVANGTYWDEQHRRHPATGSTKIVQEENLWINVGSMMMLAETGLVTFENRYVITPFAEAEECTDFRAENPRLGTLLGKLVIVGDSILATSSSEDGSIVAVEYLRMLDDTRYENRGFVLQGNEKIASWELELQKEG